MLFLAIYTYSPARYSYQNGVSTTLLWKQGQSWASIKWCNEKYQMCSRKYRLTSALNIFPNILEDRTRFSPPIHYRLVRWTSIGQSDGSLLCSAI